MNNFISWIKEKNKSYSKENIIFSDYCKNKIKQRNLSEKLIIDTLISKDLSFAELQKIPFKYYIENRHKLIYKLSNRYFLIIILLYEEKNIKVINVIKTSKDMEKKWQKKILK